MSLQRRIAEIASIPSGEDGSSTDALERIRAAGFDTVLVSDARDDDLAALCQRASARALALWLVVSPDDAGAPSFAAGTARQVKPWLIDDESARDPRQMPLATRGGSIDADDALTARWTEAVAAATGAGVTGFVCRDADRLPASLWAAVCASSDAARWIAWTPGLHSDRIDALIDAGFDTICSSLAWWDGTSGWLVDEFERHAGARRLAFPVDPFPQARVESDPPAEVVRQRAWACAALADAMLVPQSLWDGAGGGGVGEIAEINRWLGGLPASDRTVVRAISGPDSPITAIAAGATDLRSAASARLILLNADLRHAAAMAASIVTRALSGFGNFTPVLSPLPLDPCATVRLEPGEVLLFEGQRQPAVKLPVTIGRRSAEPALDWPRIAIEAVTPSVDDGRFPVKRVTGETVRVEADIIIDGHEKLAAAVLYRAVGEKAWREVRMEPLGNDRFVARFPLARLGRHEFTIEAWRDVFATYRNEIEKKSAAGLDVSLELHEGRLLVDDALAHARTLKRPDLVKRLTALVRTLGGDPNGGGASTGAVERLDRETMATRVAALLASRTQSDLQSADRRAFAVRPPRPYPVDAERREAAFASWYELFPRSLGNPPGATTLKHGTFDDVIDRLPAVREMGFDVLYFPPIHPIGKRNRKGRNNSLTALEGDPGSPYAIGSEDGGHDALHPELGTFDDFRRLREAALENGLELALDFAIQCSPDHPWLKEHPGWFAWRPDGSLRYAENPPKKYEDIVNVDFYGEGAERKGGSDAPSLLWAALRDVILLWVEAGVKIFRVDNPHTKPLPFWEWMIGEVRAKHPDTIFLSEAFTRPKVMYRLAKVGFSQSYTYFTWRHTKQEFIDYLTELTGPRSSESLTSVPSEFFRPNFFVNTPDINPVFLQRSGRPGFLIRAALAATLSGLWGVYSGFELCEATPVPGKEDYLDSEKYQFRAWDWQRPGNIIAEITALNRIRKQNPALHTHLNVSFHAASDPNILVFFKATDDRSNVVAVAINLDPNNAHETDFEVPLWQWQLPDDASFAVTDLLDERRFRWQGKVQRVRLDPQVNPYAIWRITKTIDTYE